MCQTTAHQQSRPQHQYEDRFQQPRPPSCWDPPEVQPAYQQTYHDLSRQPTCWDPPAQRQVLSIVPSHYPVAGYQDRLLEYHPPPTLLPSCWDLPRVQLANLRPPAQLQPELHPPYDLPDVYHQQPPPYGLGPNVLPQPQQQNPSLYERLPAPPQQPQPGHPRLPTCWDPPQGWQPPAWEPLDPEPARVEQREQPIDWRQPYDPYKQFGVPRPKDTERNSSVPSLEEVQSLNPATLVILEKRLDTMERRLAVDIEDSVQSREIHYDGYAIDQLRIQAQTRVEEVMLGVEEEHCYESERVLSTDSRLEIDAKEAIDCDATYDNHDSEENRDGFRTMDDDTFINEIGVDHAHRYGSDNEHSPRRASQAEEGDIDAEINDRNIISDDRAKVDYSAAALACVSAILNHNTSALVSIIDVVAALSCDARRADVSLFSLMDSGYSSTATYIVAGTTNFKVIVNSLKLVKSWKKLSDDSVVEILSLHGDFRDVSRSLHSRARDQLDSRLGASSVKSLSMALGNLALSLLYLGINSLDTRLNPSLKLFRSRAQALSCHQFCHQFQKLNEAIEVSQVEAAISGLSEEVKKKKEEIESLKKSLLENEGKVADLARKSMEKQEGMEGELSWLRLLISDYESKMEMQSSLLTDQLNYVTRLHEEICKAIKIDEHHELHDEFLESHIFELNCLPASWFPP